MTDPPGCGCLSIATHRAGAFELQLGLLRNFGLIWLASLGLRSSAPSPIAPASRTRTAPAGFTLIEMLVVIAVILVLVGLLLPGIERTFFSAKHTRQAIRQRETYVALMAYTEDHKSGFPYFGTVGDPFAPFTVNGVTMVGSHYLGRYLNYWGTLLVPKYVPDRSMLESDSGTEAMRDLDERLITAESVLTGTAFAAPPYFRNYVEGESLDFSHFRGTRTYEVLFPSDKILLISWWGAGGVPDFAHGREYQYPSTFADGATTQFSYDELVALPTAIVPLGGGIPVHTTYGGLRGRDR
ncbi:MAG: prepilin-type N-terminal cleavage/methylation domain-containing protein [Phycisphaerales bacterium]|nr:prepilin-type N-terminal cleavage/methylation domain-containing protein [Phycisphaerales bacterium]